MGEVQAALKAFLAMHLMCGFSFTSFFFYYLKWLLFSEERKWSSSGRLCPKVYIAWHPCQKLITIHQIAPENALKLPEQNLSLPKFNYMATNICAMFGEGSTSSMKICPPPLPWSMEVDSAVLWATAAKIIRSKLMQNDCCIFFRKHWKKINILQPKSSAWIFQHVMIQNVRLSQSFSGCSNKNIKVLEWLLKSLELKIIEPL